MVNIVAVRTKIVCNWCEARLLIDDAVDMGVQFDAAGWLVARSSNGGIECSCPHHAQQQLVLAAMLGIVAAGTEP